MNIDRFISERKALGYSQSELAQGICTQATLSKFENNGQIPKLTILSQLCQRLQLPLSELFPKSVVENTQIIEKMNTVEFLLITSEYEQAQTLFQSIPLANLEQSDRLRYHYLKGFLLLFQHAPTLDVLYLFDQILLSEEAVNKPIFKLLAYTGIGMIFANQSEYTKADFYFDKVLEQIYDFPMHSLEDTWRVLHIVFQAGVFFAQKKELAISNALLTYAITICSDNHVTYYLARAALQLAQNAIANREDTQHILELIYDARAYSKINRNQIALNELQLMEQSITQL